MHNELIVLSDFPICREDIFPLTPVRPPMLMVHRLVSTNGIDSVSEIKIDTTNIFVRDGKFQEAGLIENMAQTVGIGAGYLYNKSNLTSPIGFIAAIQNLVINRYPLVGETVETKTKILNTVFDFTLVEGRSYSNGELIAACNLKFTSER